MKKLFIAIAFVLLFASPSQAIELLMFSNPNCGYCQNFLKEVEPTYKDSPAGEVIPLRIISMDKPVPDWYVQAFKEKRIGKITGTPTFIIWTDHEVTRWVGYKNENHFYEIIETFMRDHQALIHGNNQQFLGKQNKDQWPGQGGELPRAPEGSHGGKHLELKRFVPDGVIDSDNIFDHTYNTPQKALQAAEFLDCGSNIHYHAKEQVWMPCSMIVNKGSEQLLEERR